jgi:iron(III) transport system substrate-binding protein
MVLSGIAASVLASPAVGPALSAAGDVADPAQIDIAKAKAEGKVMLYTSLDTQIVEAVIGAFKQKYGISVEYFRGGSADVTSKVLAEADAGRPQVDVVDASDVAALLVMKDRKLLRPFKSASLASIAPNLRDPDAMWVADRMTQAIIQYNTKEFGGDKAPRTWKDLTAPRMKGRLVFSSSANGDGAPRLYTLAKAFGWDLLKGFAANQPLRVQTPQVETQILERGERGVGFANNDNIALRSKRQGRPTDYLFPKEGVPTELGGFGLMAGSTRPNAAMLFFEWWMGKEGQDLLVKGGKYSSRGDIAPPAGSPPLKDLKILTLDYEDYRKNRSDILQRMTDIFGGEWGI